ncbi:hypothetical protein B0H16DRAFT_1719306 [Mycena metata]|uniref:Uncharacterized protein n=1 Tax=Mycena metata TaxID=1033252 RepID=A0AAD7JE07_9AGAR|nr:hypothetical protein B0H16DRAFT_1719306 [Mycena metata]
MTARMHHPRSSSNTPTALPMRVAAPCTSARGTNNCRVPQVHSCTLAARKAPPPLANTPLTSAAHSTYKTARSEQLIPPIAACVSVSGVPPWLQKRCDITGVRRPAPRRRVLASPRFVLQFPPPLPRIEKKGMKSRTGRGLIRERRNGEGGLAKGRKAFPALAAHHPPTSKRPHSPYTATLQAQVRARQTGIYIVRVQETTRAATLSRHSSYTRARPASRRRFAPTRAHSYDSALPRILHVGSHPNARLIEKVRNIQGLQTDDGDIVVF